MSEAQGWRWEDNWSSPQRTQDYRYRHINYGRIIFQRGIGWYPMAHLEAGHAKYGDAADQETARAWVEREVAAKFPRLAPADPQRPGAAEGRE
jgi:hypothetical protein